MVTAGDDVVFRVISSEATWMRTRPREPLAGERFSPQLTLTLMSPAGPSHHHQQQQQHLLEAFMRPDPRRPPQGFGASPPCPHVLGL